METCKIRELNDYIKDSISQYIKDLDSNDFRSILITEGFTAHLDYFPNLMSFNDFIIKFYALLLEDFEKKPSAKNTTLYDYLEYVADKESYKNETNKETIKHIIKKIDELEKDELSENETETASSSSFSDYTNEVQDILDCIKQGTLVFVLGKHINLCGRDRSTFNANWTWTPTSGFPPTTREVSQYLAAEEFYLTSIIKDVPEVRCSLRELKLADETNTPQTDIDPSLLIYPRANRKLAAAIDLPYLSEWVTYKYTPKVIYDRLKDIFHNSYTPTPLHTFLAKLPTKLREKNYSSIYQLIVTTNYDNVLEETFDASSYSILSYIVGGKNRGKFKHIHSLPNNEPPPAKETVIEEPKKYRRCDLNQQSIILKIHGAPDWSDRQRTEEVKQDSFVITEDHYIDYLTDTNVFDKIPANITRKLKNSNLLFLGCDLSDWRMRAILYSIWKDKKFNSKDKKSWQTWVIPVDSRKLNQKLWENSGAQILNIPLEKFIDDLGRGLEA